MVDVKPRRLDYVEQTRTALLDAAERLFLAQGYQATSIDAIAAAARFTKGAVYRHFPDKQALFVAVFERVDADTVNDLVQPNEPSRDPWAASMSALVGFLDAATEDRYRRIVLEEGPAVLGWGRWRELDQQFTGHLLAQLLDSLIAAELIEPQPVEPLARLCCAVAGEAALLIAVADNPDQMRTQTLSILGHMLNGLRSATAQSDPQQQPI